MLQREVEEGRRALNSSHNQMEGGRKREEEANQLINKLQLKVERLGEVEGEKEELKKGFDNRGREVGELLELMSVMRAQIQALSCHIFQLLPDSCHEIEPIKEPINEEAKKEEEGGGWKENLKASLTGTRAEVRALRQERMLLIQRAVEMEEGLSEERGERERMEAILLERDGDTTHLREELTSLRATVERVTEENLEMKRDKVEWEEKKGRLEEEVKDLSSQLNISFQAGRQLEKLCQQFNLSFICFSKFFYLSLSGMFMGWRSRRGGLWSRVCGA